MAKDRLFPSQLVAIDDGFAAIKIAWLANAAISVISRPAIARRGLELNDLQGVAVGGYETSGESFTVYSRASGAEPTRTESYHTSALNRVLVNHTLAEAGFGGARIDIGTGLPVRDFYSNGRPNQGLIAAKTSSLMTPVRSIGDQPLAAIESSHVYPQAMMAWIDWVTHTNGNVDEARSKRVTAVIDVGGRTTDFAVLLPGANGMPIVDHGRSGSVDLGVLNIHDALHPKLLAAFNARELSTSKLDEAIRTKQMTAFGKSHDVSGYVAEASRDVAARLLSETQKNLGNAIDIDTLLFVGGGAVVLADALASYPHVTIPSAPEFANARGILKYMMLCEPALTSSADVVQIKARA